MLKVHRENDWNDLLGNVKPNDPKIYKITKGLTHKRVTTEPLLGPNGLVFDPETKLKYLLETLFISQLNYPYSK